MSSCTTIYAGDQTFTNLYTNVQTSYYTTTGSDYTTSTPVVSSSCVTPTCSGNATSCGDAVCSTSTSYQAQTVSGGVQTITQLITSVATQLSTSYGGASTSCTSTSDSSSPSSTYSSTSTSEYTPPATTSNPSSSTHASTAAATTSNNAPLTSTSFSTVFVTSVGSNGQTSVIAVPTLLNSGTSSSNSHKSNAGAIGGGVVGGVIALLAALGFLWYLKRKGVFSKDSNDRFGGDDMWRPSAHSPDGGDHPEYVGERGSGDGSSGMMAEKDSGSLGHLGRHTYYGASELGTGPDRAVSPGGVDGYVDVNSADGHQRPPAVYRESHVSDYGADVGAASGYAAGGGQRLSHRQSLQSGSGHSHDNHQTYMPDPRLSGHYLYQPGMYEAGYGAAVPVEHLLNRANSGSVASDHSDSRTAATTGSTVAHPMPSSKRLMANLSEAAPALPRPALQSTVGSGSFVTNASGGDASLFSNSTDPSTAASSMSGGQKTPLGEVPRQVTELKGRPGLARADSVDSLLVPSQFLGARITNATPAEEKAQHDWNIARA